MSDLKLLTGEALFMGTPEFSLPSLKILSEEL